MVLSVDFCIFLQAPTVPFVISGFWLSEQEKMTKNKSKISNADGFASREGGINPQNQIWHLFEIWSLRLRRAIVLYPINFILKSDYQF